MLDEGLFQLPMFAGIERKGTFIFHKTGQPVHGLHIVQIYQDAAVDSLIEPEETTASF